MPDREGFTFLDPGKLLEGELSVVLGRKIPPDPSRGWVAAYDFEMWVRGTEHAVGKVSFRAQEHPMLALFRGHIGYSVDADHRGHHLAERSVRLLLPFIRRHGFSTIWITCNPDNGPSRRTCERLGASLVEVVELAPDEEMYAKGDRRKCRYRLEV
jgi:predicted acetyltransferase